MRYRHALLFLGLAVAFGACAYGYKRAAEAAASPLSVRAQEEDTRLKAELKATLAVDESYSSLILTADVFMARGFVVGFVDNLQQAAAIETAARSVRGLRSLQTYLPTRPASDSTASDLEIKGKIKASIVESAYELVPTRYTIEVLDGVVVLLGVTETAGERDNVGQIATGTSGVKEVKNMLLVVEEGYGSIRPHLR